MSVGLNAAQARAKSQQDMIIFTEVNSIMEAIITASGSYAYTTTISDGTTMTESTPATTVTGTVANPTVVNGETLIINGTTITFGTTGVNLNSIIADINDAGVTGVVASKDSSGYLVLTITATATSWTYDIDAASTSLTSLGLTAGTVTIANPSSTTFFDTWQGITTDRSKTQQMDEVIRYFQNLGYKVERTTNTSSNKTFQWNIYW